MSRFTCLSLMVLLAAAAPAGAAARVKFYPLDEAGNRRAALAVQPSRPPLQAARPRHETVERTALSLGPEQQTLWYEAEVR
jgi:hypothetical protein